MAQVNIGAIKFNWKGPYNNGTAYIADDVVSSGGSSYVCILASQGNAVSNGTYWQIMSSAGTDADLLNIGSTAQGDLYYNSGGAIARLAKGTAAQELRMNSGATAPEWFTASGGGVPVQETVISGVGVFSSSTHSSFVDITNFNVSITPTSTSSKIFLIVKVEGSMSTHHHFWSVKVLRKIGSGAYSAPTNFASAEDGGASTRSVRSDYDSNSGSDVYTHFTDAPNTTDAVTYKVQFKADSNSGTFYLNRNASNSNNSGQWQRGAFSKITVMELKQ
jgi:hypothetical protein